MNEQDDNRAQLKVKLQELGRRYLTRTADEVQSLQQTLALGSANPQQLTVELTHVAHRIHGSGAMLGFQGITVEARELDEFMKLRGDGDLSDAEREYVRQRLQGLERAIQSAMHSQQKFS